VVIDACKRNGSWRACVSAAAVGAMIGKQPFLGPVSLEVLIFMPRIKSHYRRGELKPDAPVWHEVRPDATKLLRAIEDAMTGIVWVDDAQVVRQHVEKRYAGTLGPCVLVNVSEELTFQLVDASSQGTSR
jgi:Holliday junction resolvase RusA-like endonuclease